MQEFQKSYDINKIEKKSQQTFLTNYEDISRFEKINSYTIEWYLNDIKYRKFVFEKNDIIIDTSFVDFDNVPNCLVISTKKYCKIISLQNGEYHQIQYPFSTKKIFKYKNGLILERDLENVDQNLEKKKKIQSIDNTDVNVPLNFKFCVCSDPFNDFEMIDFQDFDMDLDHTNDLTLLSVPFTEDYEKHMIIFLNQNNNNNNDNNQSLLYVATMHLSNKSKKLYIEPVFHNENVDYLGKNLQKSLGKSEIDMNGDNNNPRNAVKKKHELNKNQSYASLKPLNLSTTDLRSVSDISIESSYSKNKNPEQNTKTNEYLSSINPKLPGFTELSSMMNDRINSDIQNNEKIVQRKILSGSSTGLSSNLMNIDLDNNNHTTNQIMKNKINDRLFSNVEQSDDILGTSNAYQLRNEISHSKHINIIGTSGNHILNNNNNNNNQTHSNMGGENKLKFISVDKDPKLNLNGSINTSTQINKNDGKKNIGLNFDERANHTSNINTGNIKSNESLVIITLQKIIELPKAFETQDISTIHMSDGSKEVLWLRSKHSDISIELTLNIQSLTSNIEKFISNDLDLLIEIKECAKNSKLVYADHSFFKIEVTDLSNYGGKSISLVNPFIDFYQDIPMDISMHINSSLVSKFFKCIKLLTNDQLYLNYLFLWSYIRTISESYRSDFECFQNLLLIVALDDSLLSFQKSSNMYLQGTIDNNVEDNESFRFPLCILYEKLFENSSYHQTILDIDLSKLIPSIVLSLSIIREELSLNVVEQTNCQKLSELIYLLTSIMEWPLEWTGYYNSCCKNKFSKDNQKIFEFILSINKDQLNINYPNPLTKPISIIKFIDDINKPKVKYFNSLSLVNDDISKYNMLSDIFEDSEEIDLELTPRMYKMIKFFEYFNSKKNQSNIIQVFKKFDISKHELETFPLGIYSLLNQLIKNYEKLLVNVNSVIDVDLISREDLQRTCESFFNFKNSYTTSKSQSSLKNKHRKNVMNNVLNSGNQSPITYIDILNEITNKNNYTNHINGTNFKSYNPQHQGNDPFQTANKIFNKDKRLFLASRMIAYFLPVQTPDLGKVETNYELRKQFLKISTIKQMANALGWGALTFSTCMPLPTEHFKISNFNFATLLPRTNKLLHINPDTVNKFFLEDAQFHSGVASALRISEDSKGLDFNWISFNKPKNLTVQYGGFLLGLGLLGFLKGMEEWRIYNLLGSKFAPVSIGMLLGMCASARGSMDLMLNKLLCVHIDAFLPQGANDMNIHYKVQTAGLIGSGMLFERSFDKKISDLLLDCVYGDVKMETNSIKVANEGYRIGAGIALGLVNLGSSKKNSEQYDMSVGTGGELVSSSIILKLLNTVNCINNIEDEFMMDNSFIASITSLMLIFLKSNNLQIAKQLIFTFEELNQQSNKQSKNYQNVRPDFHFYRELAYNMIMWDLLDTWKLQSSLMEFVTLNDVQDTNSADLPKYYKIAGLLLAFSLKNVSSNDETFLACCLPLLDKLMTLYKLNRFTRYDLRIFIKHIGIVTQIILMSLSLVFCGSGNPRIFSRLKYFHELTSGFEDLIFADMPSFGENENVKENIFNYFDQQKKFMKAEESTKKEQRAYYNNSNNQPQELDADDMDGSNLFEKDEKMSFLSDHYSKYSTSSLAIGFLFLGCGQCSFNTTELEKLAYLVISLLPYTSQYPFELQEIKHFYSLAAENRCLLTRNCDTDEVINDISIKIEFRDKLKQPIFLETPCLLPSIPSIKTIKIVSPEYYSLTINFDETNSLLLVKKNENMTIYLKLKKIEPKNSHTRMDENQNFNTVNMQNQKINSFMEDEGLKNVCLYLKERRRDVFSGFGHAGSTKQNHENDTLRDVTKILKFDQTTNFLNAEFNRELQEEKITQNNLNINLDMISTFEDTNYQLELWKSRHGL